MPTITPTEQTFAMKTWQYDEIRTKTALPGGDGRFAPDVKVAEGAILNSSAVSIYLVKTPYEPPGSEKLRIPAGQTNSMPP